LHRRITSALVERDPCESFVLPRVIERDGRGALVGVRVAVAGAVVCVLVGGAEGVGVPQAASMKTTRTQLSIPRYAILMACSFPLPR
jgi:hypothetical protein